MIPTFGSLQAYCLPVYEIFSKHSDNSQPRRVMCYFPMLLCLGKRNGFEVKETNAWENEIKVSGQKARRHTSRANRLTAPKHSNQKESPIHSQSLSSLESTWLRKSRIMSCYSRQVLSDNKGSGVNFCLCLSYSTRVILDTFTITMLLMAWKSVTS